MATNPLDRSIHVLLVDDDRDDYLLTRDLLTRIPDNRFRLDWASDFDSGLEGLCKGEHDVYLLDYRLGAKTGLDLLAEAQRRGCLGPVILLTGVAQPDIDQAALVAGAADFLEKSRLDATILERAIRYALQKRRYEAELEHKVAKRTEELARANQALKEAARRKDEFLATLGHELRNPLAPIRNALEILRLAPDDKDMREQTRLMLERQVQQMIRLVEDLLDVSRITRGKFQLTVETVDLKNVLEAAVESSLPLFDNAGVTLTVHKPQDIRLQGDRIRLTQVFANLLNNAAKYTARGGVASIAATQEGDHAVVRVKDSGVGIPPDVLTSIFELFTQVDRTLNRSRGGLGIGLALVRRIVEMHNGTVSAASQGIDQGTEFVVHLPISSSLTTEAIRSED